MGEALAHLESTEMAHLSEELIHSTVRIDAFDHAGVPYSGTGFFFNFNYGECSIPVIVTNRHVLYGMTRVLLKFTLADSNGNPNYGLHEDINITEVHARIQYHQDDTVDLAVIYIGDVLNYYESIGKPLYLRASNESQLPTAEDIDSLTMFEEVLMIGYPNRIWDSANNLPIARRGFTATPYIRDYEGRTEFMIDAACFPGSSGSPIYLYNQGPFTTKYGGVNIGGRFALLGILHAGPQHTAEGELIIETVPSAVRAVPISRIPNHLGLCIKASRILDFRETLIARFELMKIKALQPSGQDSPNQKASPQLGQE